MTLSKSILLAALLLTACATPPAATPPAPKPTQTCPAPSPLPAPLAAHFEPADDPALLAKALGEPDKGGLCQGQVYQSKPGAQVTLYRAWNSTNPRSQLGNWWAFHQPEGKVADYRRDYEICYQWSPLDMLVRCALKPGTKVVVGGGQSALCSPYLSYPASDKLQVFIDNAAPSLADCATFEGVFSWR